MAEGFHPVLPGDAGHALWQRAFHGANGLSDQSEATAIALIDKLRLFGIGASWGGFESLVMIASIERSRTVSDWRGRRFSASGGLAAE